MGADVMAMQGARASAIMIFIMLNWINLVLACQGLTNIFKSLKEDKWINSAQGTPNPGAYTGWETSVPLLANVNQTMAGQV